MKKALGCLATCVFLTMFAANVFASSFVQDSFGIKYDVGGGRFLEDGWAWCDPNGSGIGYCYYFAPTGYILINTVAPDGSKIDMAGRLVNGGVPMTKILDKNGYELSTASYPVYGSIQSVGSNTLTGPIANRIVARNNAEVTTFNLGNNFYNAIEFTEGINPYIIFNSGANTSLTFDLTGDNLDYDGDFTMDVYVNGVFSQRFTQRFIDLTTRTITFAPYQNIELRIPIINDYYEVYIRRVYIINDNFY